MFPYIAFMSMVALSAGILNTWKRFAVPAATPVLLNVSVIAATWFLSPWLAKQGVEAIYALPVGVMVGGVLQLAVQIPALARLGLLPRLGVRPRAVKKAWRKFHDEHAVLKGVCHTCNCSKGSGGYRHGKKNEAKVADSEKDDAI
jgi:peptidoglycan biosynthesis protein MviN/MurJ (putative lipid II flippase)